MNGFWSYCILINATIGHSCRVSHVNCVWWWQTWPSLICLIFYFLPWQFHLCTRWEGKMKDTCRREAETGGWRVESLSQQTEQNKTLVLRRPCLVSNGNSRSPETREGDGTNSCLYRWPWGSKRWSHKTNWNQGQVLSLTLPFLSWPRAFLSGPVPASCWVFRSGSSRPRPGGTEVHWAPFFLLGTWTRNRVMLQSSV